MWLGIYTFMVRRIGRAGRAMNAGGIAKPFPLAASLGSEHNIITGLTPTM
jgi:hypothetical protein